MSIQIAVRLPDEMVYFLDEVVAEGAAPSRAAVVSGAIERDMRRRMAEHDAQILAQVEHDDLDSLVDWASHNLDLED
ncbi:MAG: hypothetical protein WAS54_05480 [Scrofimicrobium sp.]